MESKDIVEKLHNLEAIAYGYNINGEVLGMDCSDFEQIMVDSADYITELMEENAALRKMQPVRLDGDGAEAFALAAEVSKLRQEMEKLKAERDSARHNLETVQKMVKEYQEEIVPGFRERAEKAEAQRDAAIKELDEVAAAVDNFSDFVDEEVHPVVDYNLYLSLRENADVISMWQYEEEWRGKKEE